MKKHKTLQHAIPATIKLMPLSEKNCWNMFCFRSYGRMTEYANCVVNDEGEYKTAFFRKTDLDKKKLTVYLSKDNWNDCTYTSSKEVHRDRVFFCYFELDEKVHKKFIWNKRALNDCIDLVGTNKKTYFDKIESQGTDFTYERPYFEYYHQSILKNRRLELRRKYTDVLMLNLEIDELDNDLFVAIQKMAIEKYGVIFKILYSEGAVPCEIIEEIPVKLNNAKLWFSNRISFKIKESHLRKTPFVMMLAGGYHDSYMSSWHMKTIYEKVASVEEAEKHLKEFVSYSRMVPKLNSPWLFH